MTRTALLVTLGLAIGACAEDPTGIIFTVDSDFVVPSELIALELEITPFGEDCAGELGLCRRVPLIPADAGVLDAGIDAGDSGADPRPWTLPFSIGVVPFEGDVSRVVTATLRAEFADGRDCELAPVVRSVRFSRGRILEESLVLGAPCCGVTCPTGLSCNPRRLATSESGEERGTCEASAPAGTFECVEETCNEIDDDCDGLIDEGLQEDIFVDADGDGFGDATMTILGCPARPRSGYSGQPGDCDDGNAAFNPGVAEECDCAALDDENCDGVANEGCPCVCAPGESRRCNVRGVGGRCFETQSCMGGTAWGSCNEDPRQGPTAEVCNSIDDDCDGSIDEGGVCIATTTIAFNLTVDMFPLNSTRGDQEFNGHGPNVWVQVDYLVSGSSLTAQVCVLMEETRSDWTTGSLCRNVTRSAPGPIVGVLSGPYRHFYTDTSTGVLDSLSSGSGVTGGACMGDTEGGDICNYVLPTVPPERVCSYCLVSLGSVSVEYRRP